MGTSRDDVILGLSGNDTIYGKGGDDVICGGSGHDTIYGNKGENHLYGDQGNDILHGSPGGGLLHGGDGDDVLLGGNGDDILNGGKGNDRLYGGDGNDLIYSGPGDDEVYGEEGNNIIWGGAGDDRLIGGPDDDRIHSGPGEDLVFGEKGDDFLSGGDGDDQVGGGYGNDIIYGGARDDTLYGDQGDDLIKGDEDNDLINGGPGDNSLYGGAGKDTIIGGSDADIIDAGPGSDTVVAGGGPDHIEWVDPYKDNLMDLNPDDTIYNDPSLRCTSPKSLSLALPIYSTSALIHARTILYSRICPGDTFVLVSGNKDEEFDADWTNRAAGALKREFPNNGVVVLTSGLKNINEASQTFYSLDTTVDFLGYIYEPNWPNTPEFTWDFETTMAHFDLVTSTARSSGLRSWAKPTGRPLLQEYLNEYAWDYGYLGSRLDGMAIQTQTYCTKGSQEFGRGMDKLIRQYRQAGVDYNWYVQIAIMPGSRNTVSVPLGARCAQEAKTRGVPGIIPWWSAGHPGDLMEFLDRIDR